MRKVCDLPASVERKAQYTTGDLAVIFHVSQRSVIRWCDIGQLAYTRADGKRCRRYVTHEQLLAHVAAHPELQGSLDRISEPATTEPAPNDDATPAS